eukprot:5922897-Amphidinium_carterae.1
MLLTGFQTYWIGLQTRLQGLTEHPADLKGMRSTISSYASKRSTLCVSHFPLELEKGQTQVEYKILRLGSAKSS